MTVALALEWALVFVVVFLADVCWATYVSRVKDRDKVKASNWAAILFLMTGIATISFVKDYWLLIPACAGLGLVLTLLSGVKSGGQAGKNSLMSSSEIKRCYNMQ